jgi:hypothetical protein
MNRKPPVRTLSIALLIAGLSAGCSSDSTNEANTDTQTASAPEATALPEVTPPAPTTAATDTESGSDAQVFPDVIGAQAQHTGDSWTVSATLSSPYDTPERYADAWRVVDPEGNELGIRILGHDHASEQPFTRSLADLEIPADVTTVTIEGRDLANGWGGATFDLQLTEQDS